MRAGVANERINAVDLHFSAGIVTHGLWPGTRGDQFGVAASATRGSDAYREAQAMSGTVTDQYEYNVELTWRLPINDRFVIQPDLQYFVHPGLARRVRNSVAVGLRIDLRFGG